MKKRITVSALAVGLLLALAPVAAAHADEVKLSFATTSTSARTAEGTVAGSITGELTTHVRARRVSGNRARVTVDWIVRAGARSFTARLRGVINSRTRSGVLRGRVISGYLLGAEARAEGRLLGKNKRRFAGTLTLVDSTHPQTPQQPGGNADGLVVCEDFHVCELPVEDRAGDGDGSAGPVDSGAGTEEPVLSVPALPDYPAPSPVSSLD